MANADKVVVTTATRNAGKIVIVDTPRNATKVVGIDAPANARRVIVTADDDVNAERVYFLSGAPE